MRIKLFIYSIVLCLFAIFIIQNASMVGIKFFFWELELPRAMVLIVSFLLGVLFWALFPLKKILGKD
ncbi:LapA family protein [Brumicola blandensis]|uniref:LapA family protein n=1 Tax=Brumicola blandensis TaxID=3075611 RepID=A0AAW8QZZ6_9ALTE|nr:LapA family protein [Alteromonas sp. W409]MDT0581526.1 LapA family protein [Alteromonas sp. W409]